MLEKGDRVYFKGLQDSGLGTVLGKNKNDPEKYNVIWDKFKDEGPCEYFSKELILFEGKF